MPASFAHSKKLPREGCCASAATAASLVGGSPRPTLPEPEHPHDSQVVGEPKVQFYAVSAEAIRNLAEFLKATGWNCIYGIGMGTNTPERAADEAEFVSRTLGPRLKYFQIGNEADLFDRHLRDPQTWSEKTYLAEWLNLANAISARVPAAQFGLPDVSGNIAWLTANRRPVELHQGSAAHSRTHAPPLLWRARYQSRCQHSQPA